MRKVYYIYNPQTQTYDRIYPTVRQRALSILRRLFIGMGLGAGSFIVLLLIFGSPSEKELRKENSKLQAQYNVLSRRLDEAMGVLQDIQQRDDNLYRVIFMADPIPSAIRQAGYGGTNRYEHLMDMANSDLVINTTQKMDMISKQLFVKSVECCIGGGNLYQNIGTVGIFFKHTLYPPYLTFNTIKSVYKRLVFFFGTVLVFCTIFTLIILHNINLIISKWDILFKAL